MGTLGGHRKSREHRNITLLWVSLSWFCQLHDVWTHGRRHPRPQLIHAMMQEDAPIQDVYGELYRSQKVHSIWRYDKWKMPTFWQKSPVSWNQGFWKNVCKAFPMPTDGSWRCYALREALREPGDAEKTTMNAFYQHLKIGASLKMWKWLKTLRGNELSQPIVIWSNGEPGALRLHLQHCLLKNRITAMVIRPFNIYSDRPRANSPPKLR